MKTLIIDYGMGNLGSVQRALEECGAEAMISDDPRDIRSADHLVLPGVGAFADGIRNIHDGGWVTAIKQAVLGSRIPFLGICLGMQLLADTGIEGGHVSGLGLIPGDIMRLVPANSSERIPHVGWNEVHHTQNELFADIVDGSDFYFVHSFHFSVKNPENILATTDYCGGFVSAVKSGTIFGVQFHPEKSSHPGFKLLKNFLKL